MLQEFRRGQKLMGNHFELTVVDDDAQQAEAGIDAAIAEISRIEQLLTTYNDNSQTNQVNAMAGIRPVKVDPEMFALIRRAQRIATVTDGAFDITYGSVDRSLWNFDRNMKALPDKATAKKSVHLINYRNVLLNELEGTVFLRERGMRIGFGGIGKGYAAEQAKQVLISLGVKSGIVNASGDLCAWGTQADGKPWTVGIAHPDLAGAPFSAMEISGLAVATSGNYEKYVVIDGKRYSHTIHPKTGLPVSGIKSVTIICNNAELADAMTTPVMVMGVEAGLALINQIPGLSCLIISDDNQLFVSKNIKLHYA
ncbi:FAD:protein FMN transferase [Flavihumibacter petaseus]|uniref:FAD:protein FMN transferase n=1 Tax=Flavihumibacter petaseus NBRC 106054 TaxID=1220578 RepID=A0A0E9N5T1_9BACT|nr:FAD:protein FMN transferase [Flavihumibacter petaseus]GAO45179.1 putative ApbE family protein [Flavihumibacter petaseus NBRC 106054]